MTKKIFEFPVVTTISWLPVGAKKIKEELKATILGLFSFISLSSEEAPIVMSYVKRKRKLINVAKYQNNEVVENIRWWSGNFYRVAEYTPSQFDMGLFRGKAGIATKEFYDWNNYKLFLQNEVEKEKQRIRFLTPEDLSEYSNKNEFESDFEDRKIEIQEKMNDYVIIDGHLWCRANEPKIKVDYSKQEWEVIFNDERGKNVRILVERIFSCVDEYNLKETTKNQANMNFSIKIIGTPDYMVNEIEKWYNNDIKIFNKEVFSEKYDDEEKIFKIYVKSINNIFEWQGYRLFKDTNIENLDKICDIFEKIKKFISNIRKDGENEKKYIRELKSSIEETCENNLLEFKTNCSFVEDLKMEVELLDRYYRKEESDKELDMVASFNF